MRLSEAQLKRLRFLAGHVGAYMPSRMEVLTFKALHDRGLVAFAHTGQEGFYITDLGREVSERMTFEWRAYGRLMLEA